jgi:predicted ribosomally synthesized peptide with SipW-like signal peptide
MPDGKVVLVLLGALVVSIVFSGAYGYFTETKTISGNVFTAWVDEEPEPLMMMFTVDDSTNTAPVLDTSTETPTPEETPNLPEVDMCDLRYCVFECQHTCENCSETCEQDCKAKIELECPVVTPEETPVIEETPTIPTPEETMVIEETIPIQEETPTLEETPVVEETLVPEDTQVPDTTAAGG